MRKKILRTKETEKNTFSHNNRYIPPYIIVNTKFTLDSSKGEVDEKISNDHSLQNIQSKDESNVNASLNEIKLAVQKIKEKLATLTPQDNTTSHSKDKLIELDEETEIKFEKKELEDRKLKSILTQSAKERKDRLTLELEPLNKSIDKLTTQINQLTEIVTLCKNEQEHLELITKSLMDSRSYSNIICEIEEEIKRINNIALSTLEPLSSTQTYTAKRIELILMLFEAI